MKRETLIWLLGAVYATGAFVAIAIGKIGDSWWSILPGTIGWLIVMAIRDFMHKRIEDPK